MGFTARWGSPVGFTQDMGERDSDLGVVRYIRVRREVDQPMSWTEVWATFAAVYPGQWAVQVFPPEEELVDEANVYHLFILPGRPRGLSIRR